MNLVKTAIESKFDTLIEWLNNQKSSIQPIIYSSVDIRESAFKIASIDTNLFPAGFNNLSRHNAPLIQDALSNFISNQCPNASSVLLFCEDHTRNTFYLEHVHQLIRLIENTGLTVIAGSFFNEHPQVCESSGFLDLQTAGGHALKLYCLNYILNNQKKFNFDFCLLNNDLSDGKFEALTQLNTPIIPNPNCGWHSRKKSVHIQALNDITNAMVSVCNLPIDPWKLSSLFKSVNSVNINEAEDREQLADAASDLFKQIKQKYNEHGITDEPYAVLKSDNGTYGMGIIKITSPDDIRLLNRKNRNKLFKGKSAIPINHLIIQEGIPSNKIIDDCASEEVLYQVNGSTIGGFYRMHKEKTNKDILNAKGMQFKAFPSDFHHQLTSTTSHHLPSGVSKVSLVIAQLANLSAQKESEYA